MSDEEGQVKIRLGEHEFYPRYVKNFIDGTELERLKNNRHRPLDPKSEVELKILGQELKVRQDARKLALGIAEDEWLKGNTRYAFEAYEAAGVAPSIVFGKAFQLLTAEVMYKVWSKALLEHESVNYKCMNQATADSKFWYCTKDDCAECVNKKLLNRQHANSLYNLLGWNSPEEELRNARGGCLDGADLVVDEYSIFIYTWEIVNKTSFRAAAVAGLKLVKRLDTCFVTIEDNT